MKPWPASRSSFGIDSTGCLRRTESLRPPGHLHQVGVPDDRQSPDRSGPRTGRCAPGGAEIGRFTRSSMNVFSRSLPVDAQNSRGGEVGGVVRALGG